MEPLVRPAGEEFWERIVAYHTRALHVPDPARRLADRILQAAHLYASKWEFNLIRPLNYFDEELRDIDSSFTEQLLAMRDIEGVGELSAASGNTLVRTVNLCGQLRFQIRWSQIQRIPTSSVLGHMFVVAAYAYFLSMEQNACAARCLNNFFSGLFHDLPELLTRDIITPVKRSVEHLPSIIHRYEREELERRVLIPLEEAGYTDIRDRLAYYLGWDAGSEFLQTIRDGTGCVHALSSYEELHLDCNLDVLDPKDGRLVKLCDTLAAFLEAHASIRNGIASPELHEAMARIRNEYRHQSIGSFNVGTLLADFD
jgi:putative hydrolase of HD superfamily